MKHLLHVEDDYDIILILDHALRDAGYRVTPAGSVGEAWRLMKSGDRFDGVILDIRLPGAYGWELSRGFEGIRSSARSP